jgi:hypothetical protein
MPIYIDVWRLLLTFVSIIITYFLLLFFIRKYFLVDSYKDKFIYMNIKYESSV